MDNKQEIEMISSLITRYGSYLDDKTAGYNNHDLCKALMKAIKALEQTRWISVSERLPETDGVYIVTRRLFDNQIDTEPYYMVDACYFDGSNTWHNDNRINIYPIYFITFSFFH